MQKSRTDVDKTTIPLQINAKLFFCVSFVHVFVLVFSTLGNAVQHSYTGPQHLFPRVLCKRRCVYSMVPTDKQH